MSPSGNVCQRLWLIDSHSLGLVCCQKGRVYYFLTFPIILNSCNVLCKLAWNLTDAVDIDRLATLVVNKIFLVGVVVGPYALRGIHFQHLAILALIFVL